MQNHQIIGTILVFSGTLTVAACEPPAELQAPPPAPKTEDVRSEPPAAQRSLSAEEVRAARDVPSFAQVKLELSTLAEPLYGSVLLLVGEGDRAQYLLSALTRDQAVVLNGVIHLAGELAPVRTPEGIATYFSAEEEFDWIYRNRGTIKLGGVIDEQTVNIELAVRDADLRSDATGLLVLELRAVELSRIDTRTRSIRSGKDVVLRGSGRLTGGCEARLSSNEGVSMLIDDPKRSNARCRSLLDPL